MDKQLFYYSVLEIGASLILGVILLYIAYKVLNQFIQKKHDIDINNVAYSIFCSGVLFSVGYLISGIKSPIVTTMRLLESQEGYEGVLLLDVLQYGALFFLIVILGIIIINFLSISLFTLMTTKINEFAEIKKNNIAVGILLATIIICVSFLLKESLYLMIDSFVPYPKMPRGF